MHLDILNVPFADCAVDSIGILPTTIKGHKLALTLVCLLTSYVIAVPLKTRAAEEVTMVFQKHHADYTFYRIMVLSSKMTT